jgi:hypothetical protein
MLSLNPMYLRTVSSHLVQNVGVDKKGFYRRRWSSQYGRRQGSGDSDDILKLATWLSLAFHLHRQ